MTLTLPSAQPTATHLSLTIAFAKYQGAGNDFVLVDARPGERLDAEQDWAALARAMCDRHYGIGADGLLVAAKPEATGAVERMRMFNPDGSESEMCGNGLRCFVRWLADRGELGPGELLVETGAGVLAATVDQGGVVTVNMGRPRLAPAEIPLAPAMAEGQPADGPVMHLPIEVSGAAIGARHASPLPSGRRLPLDVTCVSMGNPHAVEFVEDVTAVPLDVVGPTVELHPAFPERTNFEVCEVVSPQRLRVRVWERGAGQTLACGTGACATLVAARLRGLADQRAVLELPGGELEVEWAGGDAPVFLTGPAVHVFDGTWRVESKQ